IQDNSFPKTFLNENERDLITYEELLNMYTISFVSEKTGLSKENIQSIYHHLHKQQPHHHLMMSNVRNEKNVQSIRSIYLLPILQENHSEDSCEIPVTFDSVFGKLYFKIDESNKFRTTTTRSISKVEKICSEKLVDDCKKVF